MLCPKCGQEVLESAVICPVCDHILDTGFLGDDILDDEHAVNEPDTRDHDTIRPDTVRPDTIRPDVRADDPDDASDNDTGVSADDADEKTQIGAPVVGVYDDQTQWEDHHSQDIRLRAEDASDGGFSSSPDTVVEARLGKGYADLIGLRTREAANDPPTSGMSPNGDVTATVERAVSEGEASLAAGNPQRAHMYAKLAISLDAAHSSARALLDTTAAAMNAIEDGVAATEDAERAVALLRQARDAEAEDDVDTCVRLLEEAIALAPEVAPLHDHLGVVLAMEKSDFARAIASMVRATELVPDSRVYRQNLGRVLARAAAAGWRPDDDAPESLRALWDDWRSELY